MKGFRILMVAGALVALAPSAHALVGKAAPEAVAELGRSISAGVVPEAATALETLKAAGFEASAARALFNTLKAPGNKAKVTGINWDAFANAAKELDASALSTLLAKLDTVNSGEALLAEISSVQHVSTVAAGPAAADDVELVAQNAVSEYSVVNDKLAQLKASDSSVDRATLTAYGDSLVRGTTQFPKTCSAGKQEHCKVLGKKTADLHLGLGLTNSSAAATKFLNQGVFTAFKDEAVNYVGHGEIIGEGAVRSLEQGDKMSPTLQSCWRNGVPLTVNP